MKFWAVLDSRGCRKKTLNCHKYATFWGGSFNFLLAKQKFLKNLKMFFCPQKVEKITSKSCILMAVGRFFLCSPDCPKQPRTSFPFYKLFYPIVSAKVSGVTVQGWCVEKSCPSFITHQGRCLKSNTPTYRKVKRLPQSENDREVKFPMETQCVYVV